MEAPFTDLQGQYLAFVCNCSVIHGRAPSEADFRAFFGTTPPTIHNMILTLERKGLIGRVPGWPWPILTPGAKERVRSA